MTHRFTELLKKYKPLQDRVQESNRRLKALRELFDAESFFKEKSILVFSAGSLGRLDVGQKSDLDFFVIDGESKGQLSRLEQYQLFAHLIRFNEVLGYPPLSNDGQYLKVFRLSDIKGRTGSPSDDYENLFTARMLLLLESQPLCNAHLYDKFLDDIVEHYCRDDRGDQTFRPLFLLNDILRYWRTLCLNYEDIRNDPNRLWRKKNVNLKFSRMLSVFGTVLPLVIRPELTHKKLKALCKMTPLERLARGLDRADDEHLFDRFPQFLEAYEFFLSLKEDEKIKDALNPTLKKELDEKANSFSQYLYEALSCDGVTAEYRRYLVSRETPRLCRGGSRSLTNSGVHRGNSRT
jgi:hypothetical protein